MPRPDTPRPPMDGFDFARDYLARKTRAQAPDSAAGCPVDSLVDDPNGENLTLQPEGLTPQLMLDALMILRLARSVADLPVGVFAPAPGTIVLVEAARATDRARLAAILHVLAPPDGSWEAAVHYLGARDRTGHGQRTFDKAIETSLIDGKPVVAICPAADDLDAAVADLVRARVRLAEADGQSLAELLSLVHLVPMPTIAVEDAAIARLSDLQLVPVLAAGCIEDAIAMLHEVCAPRGTAPRTTLCDVHGQPEAVGALRRLCDDLAAWRAGSLDWSEVVRSFLLIGPPGTGKTLLAEATAGSAGVPLVRTSYAECQRRGHQGDMLDALYRAGEEAAAQAPAVFFIDEIDAFARRSSGRQLDRYMSGVVTGLLTLIDRLSRVEGLVLMAATNHSDLVDPAVIRAGRFDAHLQIGPLDRAGIAALLEAGLPPALLSPEQAALLADRLLGMTGAQLAAMLREARGRARAARRPLAAGDVLAAAADCSPELDAAVLWRMAVHEAGHVLCAHLLGLAAPHRVSITGSGAAVLYPHAPILTEHALQQRLQILLAGRAAESICLSEVSSGSGGDADSDLAGATRLATAAETRFGFGPELTWQPHDHDPRAGRLPADQRRRVAARLRTAATAAGALLAPHRSALQRLAQAFLQQRELDAAALAALLADISPRPHRPAPRPGEAAPQAAP